MKPFVLALEFYLIAFISVHFGFTLEEVEGYESALNELVSGITNEVDHLQAAALDIWNQGHAIGVRENSYSSFTPDDVAASRAALDKVGHMYIRMKHHADLPFEFQ